MADILYWHNSEVRQIVDRTHLDGSLRIVFSAASVQRHAPGEAVAVSGFVKPLELVLLQARFEGVLTECLGGLADAELHVGSSGSDGMRGLSSLPLPWDTRLAVRLVLAFRNGSTCSAWSLGASCEAGPDARFIESYAC